MQDCGISIANQIEALQFWPKPWECVHPAADYLLCEPLVEFLLRVQHGALTLSTLLALCHQCCQLVTLKQAGYFTIGQQCIHTLQEARVQHVGLVHDEADLFTLLMRPTTWDQFMWYSQQYTDGLALDCGNSSALAMELPQSCTKPLI